jgi:hypothetical protein
MLQEIFKENESKIKLIYRYDSYMCESCILNDLDRIRNDYFGIRKEQVFIIAGIRESREEEIKVMNELMGLNYLAVPYSKMKLCKRDNNSLKYYAVIDKSGLVLSLFQPDENLPGLTNEYFKLIYNKWFSM